ncbi:epoxide hydrolase, soluble (sEH) [Coniochaeta pulveracea]|uniref:Epoxide hydrolase, soluble (SEH) n=1 Tax=Coniochaeta pulveracea TaxID=177199 RepID=A0A420YHY8_9PEZI|nr:epoxide hydrolase, soluble (sEH) [Coniochaeta pulveracea]
MPASHISLPTPTEPTGFNIILKHGHPDLVQCIAFNTYGDRAATGSVDGKIRVFNRSRDNVWRLCDAWTAHPSEILDIQWLPPTIYPNLLATLGVEGRFKLWAEDPGATAGRRFAGGGGGAAAVGAGRMGQVGGMGRDSTPKAAYETRATKSVFRSFSLRHDEVTRHTYLALLAADGGLTVLENEQVENLSDWNALDEWNVFDGGSAPGGGQAGSTAPGAGGGHHPTGSTGSAGMATPGAVASGYTSTGRPARGEETSFRVRFDPNPEVCYTALRAGVPTDALGLVVAAMDTVKVYRTRDTVTSQMGMATAVKEFCLVAELPGHRGLVRDVAWAPGNIRGHDIIATACQDGFVRVFKLETPLPPTSPSEDTHGKGWSSSLLKKHAKRTPGVDGDEGLRNTPDKAPTAAGKAQSGIGNEINRSRSGGDRRSSIKHVVTEISKLHSHGTPVWRVGFDDDGQILGSTGDDGKLMCFRQTPDGAWARSAELGMMKVPMAVPDR